MYDLELFRITVASISTHLAVDVRWAGGIPNVD